MPRALLVNPETRTITAVTIDNSSDEKEMKSIQELLNCHYFESAPQLFSRTQTLVADVFSEEVNGHPPKHQFTMPGRILGPIRGNLLILGERNGEVVDCPVQPDQLRELVKWES